LHLPEWAALVGSESLDRWLKTPEGRCLLDYLQTRLSARTGSCLSLPPNSNPDDLARAQGACQELKDLAGHHEALHTLYDHLKSVHQRAKPSP
jgi:hypothetical protein